MSILTTSFGLWRRRRDVATLLGGRVLPPGTPRHLADTVVGWGDRPSGERARALNLKGLDLVVMEDGFLTGYAPRGQLGGDVPSASYTLDTRAAHYDASRESDLEALIRDGTFEDAELARAERAIAMLRETRVSKYNAAPRLEPGALGLDRPFVLLLEQVEGDRSLVGAPPDIFRTMLADAAAAHPDHELVIRAHPAARGAGPLAREAAAFGARVLDRPCNPWPLLEAATRVFTHSSHAGFEALLAGTPVTCFGRPFYAGWGLTDDRESFERRAPRPLARVFAAAYLRASRYLDIHDRRETTLEATVEALAALRDTRNRNRGRTVTLGFSPWRRRATAPFLLGPSGPPLHARSLDAALALEPDDLVVWSTRDVPNLSPRSIRVVRLEDGFVRSHGLGAALRMPLSLVRETGSMHFDAGGVSGIERALSDDPPSEAERTRARAIMNEIRTRMVTKYMLFGESAPLPRTDRLKILVVGQVEDDASIRLGAPGIATNTQLLAAVRALFPDAFIAYRDHPDVTSGLRPGRASREHVDLDVDAQPITTLIDWCDRIETLTSLTGFEGLIRGKPVGTHGKPFYAGWGLTDDRLGSAPRGKASLEALAAVALLRYPVYIHPRSRLPCSPERAIAVLAEPPLPRPFDRFLLHPAGLALGRLKHLSRQKSG